MKLLTPIGLVWDERNPRYVQKDASKRKLLKTREVNSRTVGQHIKNPTLRFSSVWDSRIENKEKTMHGVLVILMVLHLNHNYLLVHVD